MASDQPKPPVPSAGLPPGVQTGSLWRRFVAHLIDSIVPAILATAAGVLPGLDLGVASPIISLVAGVLILGWALLVWWMFAARAAGPGMRLMRLQLVGLADGRPLGAWRYLLRMLVFFGLGITGLGLLIMLVFMTQHQRRQGWHDRVVQAVVIKQRALAPRRPKAPKPPKAAKVAQPESGAPASQPASPPPAQVAAPQPAPQSAPQPARLIPPSMPAAGSPYPPAAPMASPYPPARPATSPYPPAAPSASPYPPAAPSASPYPPPAASPYPPAQPAPSPYPPAGSAALPYPPAPLTPPPGYQGAPAQPVSPYPPARPLTPAQPPPASQPSAQPTPPPPMQPTPSPLGQPSQPYGQPPAPPPHGHPPPPPPPYGQPTPPRPFPGQGSVAPSYPEAPQLQEAWSAVLDDGRQIMVTGVVLLGRNPQPRPGEEDAQLIKVEDSSRTVSKSHLELGVNAGGMYVLDRGSTNGSTVTNASGISKRCPPGDVVMVSEGNIVSFGDHWLEVRRA